jgi:shikimate dehydrogenase
MAVPTSFLSEIVALFGRPVAENPTQYLHERAFAALGLDWRYVTLEVPPERLPDAVRGMRAMNFAGANCTLPHKVAVMENLDEITPAARKIGAVNTVVRMAGGRLLGENTDGKGFIRSVRETGFTLRGARVVILGAGGAARAIAVEAAEAGVASLQIVNRTEERGRELAGQVQERTGVPTEFHPWTEAHAVASDTQLLVNATSIALAPDGNALVPIDYDTVRPGMLACDVIPNPPDTPFLRRAREQGAATLDGLGMLVYQGAIAFKLWTGHEAPVDVMREALEAVFGASG